MLESLQRKMSLQSRFMVEATVSSSERHSQLKKSCKIVDSWHVKALSSQAVPFRHADATEPHHNP